MSQEQPPEPVAIEIDPMAMMEEHIKREEEVLEALRQHPDMFLSIPTMTERDLKSLIEHGEQQLEQSKAHLEEMRKKL